jgi:hypothetical protein
MGWLSRVLFVMRLSLVLGLVSSVLGPVVRRRPAGVFLLSENRLLELLFEALFLYALGARCGRWAGSSRRR